jgi:hypothetical protein
MQHIPVKLKAPKNSFNYFEDNQVLTAEQLNHVVQYFDYQERLTRARLLGVGIVCGLNIVFDRNSITVTKGVGVTSDGDLIVLDADKVLVAARQLDDSKANYSAFEKLKNEDGTLRLSELVETNDGATGLADFFSRNNPPQDTVVLAYLSQYTIDTDQCSADECENKGLVHHSELKFIAISRSDYDLIDNDPACCGDEYFNMPEVSIPRVLLNENDSIFSYADLLRTYGTAINNAGNILEDGLKTAAATARDLLECYKVNGGYKELFTQVEINSVTKVTSVAKKAVTDNARGIQYVYGFLKDVAAAYNEFKESVFDLCHGCCTTPDAFPKHVAIGLLQSDNVGFNRKYRSCFIESPILNNKNEALEDALHLFSRLAKLVASFNIPERATIKITPSGGINEVLGNRSIPYYYEAEKVVQHWSAKAWRRNKSNTILSYHSQQYSTLPHVTTPLMFDMDQYPFLRIEGHIGKSYDDAYIAIDNIRKQFDLPFDIAGVQLQKERIKRLPPKAIRPGILDLLYDKERLHMDTKLDYVKKYNESLLLNLPNDEELNQPAITKDYGDPKALKNLLLSKKTELDTQIATTKMALAKPAREVVGAVAWDDLHISMANAGAEINKNSKLFTAAAFRSPLENLAVLEQPRILLWLGDILQKQKQQVEDGYIFSRFLQQNPSMMHNGGVCKGGTFILVYEKIGDTETVVADFYLPYIAKDELVESKVDTTTIPIRPIKEINYTISKDIIKRPLLNTELFNVKDELSRVKDLTNNADIAVGKRLNDFDIRINKVGQDVLVNRENIGKEVAVVKDKYETSFSKLISSYDTVVTKGSIKVNTEGIRETTMSDFEELITGVRTEFNGKILETENKLNTRVTTVANELTATKAQITKTGNDLVLLDGKLNSVKTELTSKVTADVKVVNDRVTSVENGFDAKLVQTVATNDTRINSAIAVVNRDMAANAQAFDGKLATLKNEVIVQADRSVTEKLNLQKAAFDQTIGVVNREITTIKNRPIR